MIFIISVFNTMFIIVFIYIIFHNEAFRNTELKHAIPFTTFLHVLIYIIAGDCGRDTEEDEPVAGGELGALVEPRRGDTGVLQYGLQARLRGVRLGENAVAAM